MDATFGIKGLQLALDGIQHRGATQVNLEHHHILIVVDEGGQVENVDRIIGAEGGDRRHKANPIRAGRGEHIDILLCHPFLNRRIRRGKDGKFERELGVAVERAQAALDLLAGHSQGESGEQDHGEVAAQHRLAQVGNVAFEAADTAGHLAHNTHAVARHNRNDELVLGH